jgi:hypothetical protein
METTHTTPLLPALPANLAQTAALALDTNKGRNERALAAAEPLLALSPETMTPEQDALVEEYLVRARRTLEQMQTERAPVTRAFDAVRAEFTQLEAPLDPKKKDAPVARLQALRDAYASLVYKREEAKRAAAAALARHAEAAAGYRATLRAAVDAYPRLVERHRLELQAELQSRPLAALRKIAQGPPPPAPTFTYPAAPRELTPADVAEINEAATEQLEAVIARARTDWDAQLSAYVAQLLQARESKDKEAQQRLAAEAEQARLAQAEQERLQAARAEAEQAQAVAEARAGLTVDLSVKLPKGKAKLSCEVLTAAAYQPLLAIYLEHLAPTTAPAELAKVTLGKLAAWAGDYASQTGETIDHPGLRYVETFKTTAR